MQKVIKKVTAKLILLCLVFEAVFNINTVKVNAQTEYNHNLIMNGDPVFGSTLAPWVSGTGGESDFEIYKTVTEEASPQGGDIIQFATDRVSEAETLTQTMDISDISSDVDIGSVNLNLSGYLQKLCGDSSAEVRLDMLASDGSVKGNCVLVNDDIDHSGDLSPVWQLKTTNAVTVAKGTRALRVTLYANISNQVIPYSDYIAFDNITLILSKVNVPDILVSGNGVNIANGDTTPDTADYTDLGTCKVGETLTKTFVVINTGTADLNLSAIMADKPEFNFTISSGGTLTAGGTALLTVTFTGSSIGEVNAAVTIGNNTANDNPFIFHIKANVTSSPVTDFKLTGRTTTTADFSWTAVTGASGMAIYQSADGGISWTKSTGGYLNTAATIVSVWNLTPSEDYKFKLVVTGGNNAGDSNIIDVATCTPIQNLAVSERTPDSVTFTWSPAVGATGIGVYKQIDGGWNCLKIESGEAITTTTVYGLNANTSYTFKIEVIGGDNAGYSDPITVTTTMPVSDLRIKSKTSTTATLEWSQPVGASRIYINKLIDTLWTLVTDIPGDATSVTITGLSPNTTYNFKLLIIGGEQSGDSEPVTVTTTPGPGIEVYGNNISIANGDTTPDESDNTEFGSEVVNVPLLKTFTVKNTGFEDLILGGIPQISGANSSDFILFENYSDLFLSPGETGTFSILFSPGAAGERNAAVSVTSNDTNEGPFTFSIKGNGRLPATVLMIDRVTPTTADLRWIPVMDTTAATIYQSVDGIHWAAAQTEHVDLTSATAKVTGLTTGNTYFFKIAVTAGLNSGGSSVLPVTPVQPVTDFRAVSVMPDSITFLWTAKGGATNAAIMQSSDGGISWVPAETGTIPADADSAFVSGLSPNTTYQFQLVALYGFQPVPSNTITVTTADVSEPGTTPGTDTSITPSLITFDKYTGSANNSDKKVFITGGLSLENIKNGTQELNLDADYAVSGSAVTIYKTYLDTLETGTSTLIFHFGSGIDKTLSVLTMDTTSEDEENGVDFTSISSNTFDKYTKSTGYEDITVNLALNGVTFSGIKNGNKVLSENRDYTVSGSAITINKSYLAHQTTGIITITLLFSSGVEKNLVLTITNTKPLKPSSSADRSSGSGGNRDTAQVREVLIKIGTGGDKLSETHIPIIRTTGSDGTVKDFIELSEGQAAAVAANTSLISNNMAIIDLRDSAGVNVESADIVEMRIAKTAAAVLSQSNIGLIVKSVPAVMELPLETMLDLNQTEISITISEIKDKQLVAKSNGLLSQLSAGSRLLSNPISIVTNYSKRTKITIPIKITDLPTDKSQLEEFISSLAVLVEHSDGETRLQKGTIEYDEAGHPMGVSIWVDKFNTFTLVQTSFTGTEKVLKNKQKPDKVLKVKLSSEIAPKSITEDTVYVLDSRGNKVEETLKCNGNTITIEPVNKYKSGETYTLFITENVLYKSGKAIENGRKYRFTIGK
ncbi:X2-like carbohydrate binding domain-containing protein [Anaerocolumna sp. MB42-C2]|uniref:X2-like carbohydrate binding domain-containing protein n=1 Tax=Anaerocolumna sp. MB42-C2 TaxID=3070997 RepID=UPI0027DF48D5|nr:X2-like carbohydrate binding domain-containing protein [Anaerocolumna sp. MB42-C2]WMJ89951.1 X2-like carbohydrate binding domain-containing protein [Anaerocolumna sp. MB42-C2]